MPLLHSQQQSPTISSDSGGGPDLWVAPAAKRRACRTRCMRARDSFGAGVLDTSRHLSNELEQPRGKGPVPAWPLPGEAGRAQVLAPHTWEREMPTPGSAGASAQSQGSGQCHPWWLTFCGLLVNPRCKGRLKPFRTSAQYAKSYSEAAL